MTTQQLKQLIADDKIEQAIDEILRITEGSNLHNDVVLQSGRFHAYKKDLFKEIKSKEENKLQINQITTNLLLIIDQLANNLSVNEHYYGNMFKENNELTILAQLIVNQIKENKIDVVSILGKDREFNYIVKSGRIESDWVSIIKNIFIENKLYKFLGIIKDYTNDESIHEYYNKLTDNKNIAKLIEDGIIDDTIEYLRRTSYNSNIRSDVAEIVELYDFNNSAEIDLSLPKWKIDKNRNRIVDKLNNLLLRYPDLQFVVLDDVKIKKRTNSFYNYSIPSFNKFVLSDTLKNPLKLLFILNIFLVITSIGSSKIYNGNIILFTFVLTILLCIICIYRLCYFKIDSIQKSKLKNEISFISIGDENKLLRNKILEIDKAIRMSLILVWVGWLLLYSIFIILLFRRVQYSSTLIAVFTHISSFGLFITFTIFFNRRNKDVNKLNNYYLNDTSQNGIFFFILILVFEIFHPMLLPREIKLAELSIILYQILSGLCIALLVGKLDSRYLKLPFWIIISLYLYSIIQPLQNSFNLTLDIRNPRTMEVINIGRQNAFNSNIGVIGEPIGTLEDFYKQLAKYCLVYALVAKVFFALVIEYLLKYGIIRRYFLKFRFPQIKN